MHTGASWKVLRACRASDKPAANSLIIELIVDKGLISCWPVCPMLLARHCAYAAKFASLPPLTLRVFALPPLQSPCRYARVIFGLQ